MFTFMKSQECLFSKNVLEHFSILEPRHSANSESNRKHLVEDFDLNTSS